MADMVASQVHTISTHKGDITSLAFSNDKLATVSGDKTVRLWSTDDYSELPCSPLLGHSYIIHYCTFSPFGTILATCSTDGKLILWEPRSGEVKAEFQHPSKSSIRVCKFSPDSTRIASGGDDDTICLWEIATRKLIRSYSGLEDSVVTLTFSPDGHYLVSGSPNGDLYVWDAEFGHGRYLSLKVDAHDLGVTCCEFSPTFGSAGTGSKSVVNLLLATGGKDNLIKLWTFAAQVGSPEVLLKCHASLPGHTDIVMSCAFSPSGFILASGSSDKTVRFWDPLRGVALFSIDDCHSRFVTCCAFSGDGSHLATGSMDRTVKIWKLTDTSGIMYGLSGYEEPEAVPKANPLVVSNPLEKWTVEEVVQWLDTLGLGQYQHSFRSNAVDGRELLALTAADLETHLAVVALGHRNKILRSRDQGEIPAPAPAPAPSAPLVDLEESGGPVAPHAGERVQWKFSKPPGPVTNGHAAPLKSEVPQLFTPQRVTVTGKPSRQWTVEEVVQWLDTLGLGQYQDNFRQNAIDGTELLTLTATDLEKAVGVSALGHRNKILRSRDPETSAPGKSSGAVTNGVASTSKGVGNDHSEFLCPITMEMMRDPVIAADGYTYDRSAIRAWLEKGKDRSPMTNAVLPHKNLTPNRTLKMLIQKHLEEAAK